MIETKITIPLLEDLPIEAQAATTPLAGDPDKEYFALATAIYSGAPPEACTSQKFLTAQMVHDYGAGNVMILHSYPRLAYPYSPLYAVASMFKTEEKFGRKADWLLWLDDDVLVPKGICRWLREAADPEDRPFVAAVGYDRIPPFLPAVWDFVDTDIEGANPQHRQWIDMPEDGVFKVSCTGLCAALFHRSLFDRVSQPWFAVVPSVMDSSGQMNGGINPDTWWCEQLRNARIPCYVACKPKITHLGAQMPVNYQSAPRLRAIFQKAGAK